VNERDRGVRHGERFRPLDDEDENLREVGAARESGVPPTVL